MKLKLFLFSAFLLSLNISCSSEKSGGNSTASATVGEKLRGNVWRLKSFKLNDSDVAFKGNAYLEFKADNTFVTYEEYMSVPTTDYGPCWYLSKGTATISDASIVTKMTNEVGRDECKGNDTSETTENWTLTDGLLTTTETSKDTKTITVYEKETTLKILDYDALAKTVGEKGQIKVDTASDSYIQDKNENDNLKHLLTECELGINPKINQYFKSEAMGDARIVKMDYSAPSLAEWVNGKFTREETSDSCNAPGYRSLITNDLQAARASNSFDALYACGATCTYTLVSETHDSSNSYTSLSMTWECLNVGGISYTVFGNVVDKHVGKVTCQ